MPVGAVSGDQASPSLLVLRVQLVKGRRIIRLAILPPLSRSHGFFFGLWLCCYSLTLLQGCGLWRCADSFALLLSLDYSFPNSFWLIFFRFGFEGVAFSGSFACLGVSASHFFAISGWLACIHFRCASLLNGILYLPFKLTIGELTIHDGSVHILEAALSIGYAVLELTNIGTAITVRDRALTMWLTVLQLPGVRSIFDLNSAGATLE